MGFRPSVIGTIRRLTCTCVTAHARAGLGCSRLEEEEHTGKPQEEVDTHSSLVAVDRYMVAEVAGSRSRVAGGLGIVLVCSRW